MLRETRLLSALSASMFALVTATGSQAITITTAEGNGADTYLTNDTNSGPTEAHGAESAMEIRHHAARLRVLYVRFDISNVTGDLSGASVTINGTTVNRTRPISLYALADGSSEGQGEAWDEATLSYSDAAGYSASADATYTLSASMSRVGTFAASAAGLNTTDPSTDLDDFLAADTDGLVTFSMLLEDVVNGSEDFWFTTKEAGDGLQPVLDLPNASFVPEPASLALIALGGLATIRRRR